MEQRYTRNIPAISEKEQLRLQHSKVAVIGCGGLGGYLCELSARAGIGSVTAVDGDVFDESNLNRQLLSTPAKLGMGKAEAAGERIREINPEVEVRAVHAFFTAENARSILEGCDLVLDALDNVPARLLLEDVCGELGLPIVHGAIAGWNAQVGLIMPGSGILHTLYGGKQGVSSPSTLPATPAYCAALQMTEAIRFLCGRKSPLENSLLITDLLSMETEIFPFAAPL